jgi:phosphosulfolactate synthase (CoM biosynthesis protein A)
VQEISYELSQASGMVSVQAECSLTDALQMMNDRAQVQHQTLSEIADGVRAQRIRFDAPPDF